ncbi:enoyl-[acyl-carrier-protein] reductase FabK [Alloiococcus sp. CFN-8]|uniref:enoyl-[acyl-carrier-protein] reductase FabK n=1 Tax=Alloiococcus sp. CFN-8 TaxID=3416081 RepID=UPI003CF9E391
MSKTDICSLLGIKYPIFQGGMAWIADGRLAAAVSNGGGLGIISAMNADSKYLLEQINIARELTDKPFGVNVMLMSPHVNEVAELLAKEKVPVITTGAGNPSKYIPMWNEAGIKVIPVVASVAVAKLVTRAGAAAVIAEGGESGGHVGEITTLALIPQISDATPLPVVAAGGIADGRGVAAAFMLGAQGVQLGTRFLVAHECNVHANYKQRILKAKDIDTITTGKRLGHPVRSLKSQFSREYFKKEYDSSISNEDLEQLAVGSLRLAVVEGDEKRGSFLAGQSSGLIKKEQPAAEIIEEIFKEAKEVLRGSENILNGALKWVK